jgi:hypothetical protein
MITLENMNLRTMDLALKHVYFTARRGSRDTSDVFKFTYSEFDTKL